MKQIIEQLVHGYFNARHGQAVESIDFVNTRYDPDTHIFTTVVEVSIARRKQDLRTIEVHFELVNLHVWMTTPADKAVGGCYVVTPSLSPLEDHEQETTQTRSALPAKYPAEGRACHTHSRVS